MSGAWLSRQGVLAALGVHRQTLWRLQRDKNFPQSIQRGFFQERDVLNWMRRHRWRKHRRHPANLVAKPSRRRDRTDARQLPLGPNPTTGIMRVQGKHKAHKRWPMQVIEACYVKANRVMRLALYLLLYTGQREIDVIAMKWTDVQRRGDVDMIHVVQQKTGSKVWIPIHPKLAALLAKTPRTNNYILNTNRREPFASTSSISNTIKSTLRQCGIDNWKDYSGHGLRASAACELLEAGCNESLVAAITGHKDLKVLRRYLEEVNQEKRTLGYSKLIALRVRVSPKNKALLATTKSANLARKPR